MKLETYESLDEYFSGVGFYMQLYIDLIDQGGRQIAAILKEWNEKHSNALIERLMVLEGKIYVNSMLISKISADIDTESTGFDYYYKKSFMTAIKEIFDHGGVNERIISGAFASLLLSSSTGYILSFLIRSKFNDDTVDLYKDFPTLNERYLKPIENKFDEIVNISPAPYDRIYGSVGSDEDFNYLMEIFKRQDYEDD